LENIVLATEGGGFAWRQCIMVTGKKTENYNAEVIHKVSKNSPFAQTCRKQD
jgi:hypothetical protein